MGSETVTKFLVRRAALFVDLCTQGKSKEAIARLHDTLKVEYYSELRKLCLEEFSRRGHVVRRLIIPPPPVKPDRST